MNKLQPELESIEQELRELSSKQKKQWQRIAYLLIVVQRGGMFAPHFKSYTEWLRQFAHDIGMHESSFWRYYNAGSYYLDKTAIPVEQLEIISVSPKKLEIVKRIEEHDAAQGHQLFEMLKTDDPQATMSYLTETWEKIRDGKTHAQKQSEDLSPVLAHLMAEFHRLDENAKAHLFESLASAVVANGMREIFDQAAANFKASQVSL